MKTSQTQTGYFGNYGGQFVSQQIAEELNRIADFYNELKDDPAFQEELKGYLKDYSGRKTPLYFADALTEKLGGAKIYLKREDLNHLGAHKINNALGQVLLAKRMGKTRIIAETGAGQHGVATAAVAAKFGMECVVYMGKKDYDRQQLNVFRMKLMGAECVPVTRGGAGLFDAVNQAFLDLAERLDDTFYLVGSAVGPHPYPTIVRDFQAVISEEMRAQIFEKEGRLPDAVIACVGGGSNAIGSFHNFVADKTVRLIGVEAAGKGLDTNQNAASINLGEVKTYQGMKSYFTTDADGNVRDTHSVSAGLDYPGVSPEHAMYHDIGRAEFVAATDQEALDAFALLSLTEGIIPALESAHALAYAAKLAPGMNRDQIIIVNLSGRGDKDVPQVMNMI
ncbi:MAG: tryptophan synthase subunit beta [Clostridiaceae bacterium]|jgi:tryptophan synthase beta chain|nr:tryptophan synthase subunit beta [Clostridiaceae bacterium]